MQSRKRVSWILFIVTSMATFVSGQIHAGQGDLIFHSSFERGEGCSVFNGLNDNILVPVVSISGDFTLNNEAFPGSEYDDAVFSLRDRLTGSVFELGNSHDHSYTANVVPGYYDVLYSLETASSPDALVPRNIGAVLMENVALLVNQTMDINVTGYSLGGDMLHNGVLFPASEYNDGVIFLDSGVKGRLQLGDTKQQTFSGVVALAGDYEVRYQAETPDTVPWNLWGLVDEINISGDNNALNINVESVLLEGSFLHNGVLMPATEYDDGNFYLETPGGDRALLDNSHAVNYEKTVIPGNYDIFWELETPGDTVPFNLRARVGSKVSVVSGKLNINMNSTQVAGDFSLNGGAFPVSNQNMGQIVFRDQATGIESVLAQTKDGSYDHRIVRGVYDIVYQHLIGLQVPQNKNALLGAAVIKTPANIDIDVPARLFQTAVLHNGVLFPAAQQQAANMLLRNGDSGDLAFIGKTSLQNLSALVVHGTYDVYYSHLSGTEIPQNKMARTMQGLVIAAPGPAIQGGGGPQLNVNSVVMTGQFLLNDAPMPASEYDDGLIKLRRAEDQVLLGNTHDQNYEARVVDQDDVIDFIVHYESETRSAVDLSLPFNGDAEVMCVRLEPIIF